MAAACARTAAVLGQHGGVLPGARDFLSFFYGMAYAIKKIKKRKCVCTGEYCANKAKFTRPAVAGFFFEILDASGDKMKRAEDFQGIYIHKEIVDMRKMINGLCDIVQSEGMGDLRGPHLFVFCGRRRNVIKVLYFDKSGFALWIKRLEENKFPWPKKIEESVVKLTAEQFEWLLEGYDVWKMKPFKELYFERVS